MPHPSVMSAVIAPKQFELNWIVNKRADLIWFIGGALCGYTMFFLHAGLHLDMLTIWFLWIMLIDTPHFFGTYSRTYFDKEEWNNRKPLYIGSFAWLLLGPTCIFISYLLYSQNIVQYKIPFIGFIVFFNMWAYWHVVRQHYGIMSLYKRKNNDFAGFDRRLDQAILYCGLIAPFIAFVIRHPEARITLGLEANAPAFPANFALISFFEKSFWAELSWENYIFMISVFIVTLVSVAFIARQVQLYVNNQPLNLPKIFFLIALIPLYAYICYHPAVFTAPLMVFSAFVTIYHDVQYLAIVWFYNKNRYHKTGVKKERYGLAIKINKNFLTFMACAVAMGVIFRLMGCSLELHPGCGVLVLTSKKVLFGALSTKELLASMLLGFSLQHYFLDQYIWRPGKDKKLREDLKLQASLS